MNSMFDTRPLFSFVLLCFVCVFNPLQGQAQVPDINEDQLGGWYAYIWSKQLKDSQFGFQGDFQFRNWDLGGDLEQLLLRGGLTYTLKGLDVKFTLGYAFIQSGEFGDSNVTFNENRIYQEALLKHKLGDRTYFNHRFRFEQRWVDDQDFRTRWRYALNINVALNRKELVKGTFFYAFANEIFINGQRDIGNGREVELFDRNRIYNSIGYCITDELKILGGYTYQITDNWNKGQIVLALAHSF